MISKANHPRQISTAFVQRLISDQFPQWADLSLSLVVSSGTANNLFRLGEDMTVRFPQSPDAVHYAEKEHRWLATLAPQLPLPIPVPIAKGEPVDEFPWIWGVYNWLQGDDGWARPFEDLNTMAEDLAGFMTAMQAIDPTGGPASGKNNNYRGIQLSKLDLPFRSSVEELGNRINKDAVLAIWDRVSQQPLWNEARWIHGDLHPGNLLSHKQKLSAVIDFDYLGVGDPACDLMPAWHVFDAESRQIFRDRLNVDDATWARGQGWSLLQAIRALPFYWDKNPVMVQMSKRTLREILSEPAE